MASVSSLDQDMRRLRMERVTPQAEEEVRTFVQSSLKANSGEKSAKERQIDIELLARLERENLFDVLADGTVLCRYECIFMQRVCRALLMRSI